MNCIYIRKRKQKNKTYFYCTLKKSEVSLSCYKECDKKEYKKTKTIESKKDYKMKTKSSKLAKMERNRFSIIYDDLSKCCVKGCTTPFYRVEKNEVFEGACRGRSIIYGAVVSFCKRHHELFHNNISFNLEYKMMFQKEYVVKYSLEWFIKTFGQNYEFRYEKIKKY